MPFSFTRPPSRAPRTPLPVGCIFCDIVAGRKPGSILADETPRKGGQRLVAFLDHRPAARVHVLVVPAGCAGHIDSVYDLEGEGDLGMLHDMVALGERVVNEECRRRDLDPPATVKTGFHYPPLYSISHIHLHAFSLPHTVAGALRFKESGKDNAPPPLWFVRPSQVAARVRDRQWEEGTE